MKRAERTSPGGRHFANVAPISAPRPKAVSIGGGTGQPNAIRALFSLGFDVSAVVSMVDDGGSTGILRNKANMVPPGDVRKCLSAMAQDPNGIMARAFEHRFSYADNHTLGNLMLTALTAEAQSFPEAIDICANILKIRGAVLPSTIENVKLSGVTKDGLELNSEARLGQGPCALERVWLEPNNPQPYQPAIDAILAADAIVLGPGSLFTSVIPNLLVPGIIDAIRASRATVVFVCSMADMQGETWGLSAEEHIQALLRHGMEGLVDVALIHKQQIRDIGIATRSFVALTGEQIAQDAALRAGLSPEEKDGFKGFIRPVEINDEAVKRISAQVPLVLVRDFAEEDRPTWHSEKKLAAALKGVIPACHSPQK